jgi:hypothetical protein
MSATVSSSDDSRQRMSIGLLRVPRLPRAVNVAMGAA